ncbi:unnamed protein product [Chironomus riparius]|uniref:UDP-glucuronosyltransferase n=1 Tax=Chironomus riparius TaxID=315576 RepID=A0A9N9RS61_9DIPT|nr:unnamed protein product [Chironomus riparius]
MKFSFILFVFGFFVINCSASLHSNILFLSGVPSPSHYIYNKALAEALALRGHNVTFVSPDVSNKVIQNFHYIHLDQVYEHCYNDSGHINLLDMSKQSPLKYVMSFHHFNKILCEGIKMSKGIEVIKKYPNSFKFDLVINDYVCGPCLLGLLPKFKYPPLVGISAFNNPPYTVDIVGGDKLGLTVKPFYLLYYDEHMSFGQRMHNGFINFFDSFYRKYSTTPAIDKHMKEIYGSETPYGDDLDKKASIMLVNSHPAVDYPEPLPQNVIQVGGLQINDPKVVPDDINEFIKKGKKGTILMALGTNIKSDEIGEHAIMNIIEAFRHMPDYNFLWKFESPAMLKELSSNVMIKDWLPQNDILAHPQVKVFITHGGLLSIHEAVWHGVPMVIIPFVADQHRNCYKSVQNGIGVKVDYHTINSEKLRKAIVEVLHNPKYRKNVQQRSKLFKDQPEKPIERAVWWCEFIMRHPKITHLKATNYKLPFLGSHFWDIKVIIIWLVIALVFVTRMICKTMFVKEIVEITKKEIVKKVEVPKHKVH